MRWGVGLGALGPGGLGERNRLQRCPAVVSRTQLPGTGRRPHCCHILTVTDWHRTGMHACMHEQHSHGGPPKGGGATRRVRRGQLQARGHTRVSGATAVAFAARSPPTPAASLVTLGDPRYASSTLTRLQPVLRLTRPRPQVMHGPDQVPLKVVRREVGGGMGG